MKRAPRRLHRSGFSLVELMVAIVLSLFLVGAMVLADLSAQRAWTDQDRLVQVQDNLRLIVSMTGATLSHAGYVSPEHAHEAALVRPALGVTVPGLPALAFGDGEFIVGLDGASGREPGSDAASDVIAVRYQSSGLDGAMDCGGRSNAPGTSTQIVNILSISAQGELLCATPTVAPVALADGIARMVASYGVDIDRNGSVDTYLSAAATRSLRLWSRVYAVRLTLWIVDDSQPGATPPATWPAPLVHTFLLENQP